MEQNVININSCNNITSANIKIQNNSINIKFGPNGTGKTTISQALFYKTENHEDLKLLNPYNQDGATPNVGDIPFKNVKVFNELFIKQYLFQEKSIIKNSYNVLLKSSECEKIASDISKILYDLQTYFVTNAPIKDIQNILDEYVQAVNFSDGKISKRGGIGELVKGRGAGFEKHSVLDAYRPYYSMNDYSKVASWTKWRFDGISQMSIDDLCPFCANHVDTTKIENQNNIIKKVFKSSAVKIAVLILEYLDKGIEEGYINKGSNVSISKYLGDPSKETELTAELTDLGKETFYLKDKIKAITSFRPMNVKQEELENIDENLKKMRFDMKYLSKFYNTKTVNDFVNDINTKIDNLLESTDRLKGLFLKHQKKIQKLISERKDDVNNFFQIAGFPYEFEIEEDGENNALTFLKPAGNNIKVESPENHLSWGERNAFSLVMFMFEAVSENADLIVLDDPISSFDKSKKFAIIKRLFSSNEVSFRNKTVLLLTHDLQPVIDFVHVGLFKKDNITVVASYLKNDNGRIIELDINDCDLKNVVNLTLGFAKDKSLPLHTRIVNLRKYYELQNEQYSSSDEYQLLSNLIHGRCPPELKNGTDKQPFPQERLKSALDKIAAYNLSDDYKELINDLSTEKLLESLQKFDIYNNLIAIRLIFERQGDLASKFRKKFPHIYKLLNETNHIENDYVFQLDPSKFFYIPESDFEIIRNFISENLIYKE